MPLKDSQDQNKRFILKSALCYQTLKWEAIKPLIQQASFDL